MWHCYSIRPKALFFAVTLGLGTVSFASAQDAASTAGGVAMPAQDTSEAAYLADINAAMNKMMAAMAVKPSGDVDRDFVAMMVPHHQAAIDMAQTFLRYGHNEQLRRLAQEIIVTQQQEIATMRLAIGEPQPPSVASPTQPAVPHEGAPAGGEMHHNSRSME
jgi:hypothetical protein